MHYKQAPKWLDTTVTSFLFAALSANLAWLIYCVVMLLVTVVEAQVGLRNPAFVAKLNQPTVTGLTFPSGTVAYWKLDEVSGTRADATGRGNTLTDNNTVTQSAGKINDAAQFVRANSESLSLADNADVSLGDIDYSISFWFYLDTLPSGADTYFLVAKDGDSPANSRDISTYVGDDAGTRRVSFSLSGGTATVTSSEAISATTWYHVIITHNATANTINLYINNGTVNTAADGSTFDNGGSAFTIGSRIYSGFEGYNDGRVDEVGIWKRVLASDERTLLYNLGNGLAYP